MDDLDLMILKALEDSRNEFLNPGLCETAKDKIGENEQLEMDLADYTIKKAMHPLPTALFELMTFYEVSLWGEPIKKRIVSQFSIVEKEFKKENGIHLVPQVSELAYQIVCGYEKTLAEFDVDQQEQFIKMFDAVHKHVVPSRQRS